MKKLFSMLILCALAAGCESLPQQTPEGMAIDAVYSVDKSVLSNSDTLSSVASRMQNIRLTGCPPDFVDAFRANAKAWTNFCDIERDMYTQNIQKAKTDISKFLEQYQSDKKTAFDNLKKQWPKMSDKIDTAEAEILRSRAEYIEVGAKYSAENRK